LTVMRRLVHELHMASYLGKLLFPIAGLALLSPRWLLPAAPAIAVNMFADYSLGREFKYHYQIEIMPWVYLAAFQGALKAMRLCTLKARQNRLLLCLTLIVAMFTGRDAIEHGRLFPFCGDFDKNRISLENLELSRELRKWLSQHVDDARKVASTGGIVLPQLTHRTYYGMVPNQNANVSWDYFVFDLDRLHWEPNAVESARALRARLQLDSDYELAVNLKDRIEIYQRR